jgi:L-alanine-DL-glutamate epimerase-like enolase superfamily enzyme
MKITRIRTELVEVPLDKPIATAIHSLHSVGCVLLSIETDEGLVGEAYAFSINAVRLKAFDEMITSFDHQLIGKDPHYVEAIWQNIWKEINPIGHRGMSVSALSTIDTACWDLIGKAANKPLHHLFGACRDSIKTYASAGLWLSQTIDELQAEAADFIEQGFRGMKMRLGSGNTSADVERVKAVRESIGDNIELMVDLNQALTPKAAIQLGRSLEEFNLTWIEEPVAAYDLKGHAKVTQTLDTPIASGETEYNRFAMQQMIEQCSCDILMPDLQRIGGLTEMRNVAALASANNMPISTHIFTEQSLCIAGSASNCISVEHIPWYSPLFREDLVLEEGKLVIPNRPGLGFTFDPQAIKRYAI